MRMGPHGRSAHLLSRTSRALHSTYVLCSWFCCVVPMRLGEAVPQSVRAIAQCLPPSPQSRESKCELPWSHLARRWSRMACENREVRLPHFAQWKRGSCSVQ
jgi:hypothetical protein